MIFCTFLLSAVCLPFRSLFFIPLFRSSLKIFTKCCRCSKRQSHGINVNIHHGKSGKNVRANFLFECVWLFWLSYTQTHRTKESMFRWFDIYTIQISAVYWFHVSIVSQLIKFSMKNENSNFFVEKNRNWVFLASENRHLITLTEYCLKVVFSCYYCYFICNFLHQTFSK